MQIRTGSNAARWAQALAIVLATLTTTAVAPGQAWDPVQAEIDNRPLELRLEGLLWWLRGTELPPLVTTSPPDTPPEDAGVPGVPGTEPLLGADQTSAGLRGGFRAVLGLRLGHWFDRLGPLMLDLDYLRLEEASDAVQFRTGSSGDPILARPFFDQATSSVGSVLVAYPNLPFPDAAFPGLFLDRGAVQVNSSSDVDSAGALLRQAWRRGRRGHLDLLAGYRYWRFREGLNVRQEQIFAGGTPGFPNPDDIGSVESQDSFSLWNEFHGGDLGIELQLQGPRLGLELLAKLAIGNLHQIREIAGETIVLADTGDGSLVEVSDSGLLANPSNRGRRTGDRLTLIPEFGVTLRRVIWWNSSATVRYSLVVMPDVLRVGDQVDLALPVDDQPAAGVGDTSTLWMHGIHVGLEW
jgi:hypothetical protein